MIPPFTSNGCLPQGIHVCHWDDFAERFLIFDHSDQRLRLGDKIRHFVADVRSSQIAVRLYIAGSFVTVKAEPNDFDALLVIDPSIVNVKLPPFQYNVFSRRMLRKRFGGDVLVALDGTLALERYLAFFQTSRAGEQVGIVEIEL